MASKADRQWLVERVTGIITAHQVNEMGRCALCAKNLYNNNSGGGMSLSRHHAEAIVESLGLVDLFAAHKKRNSDAIAESTPRQSETG